MSKIWPRPAKFTAGAKVRVRDDAAVGHCRSPHYLRGLEGEVATIHGAFRDPERLAYHTPGLPPQVLYKVRFRQTDVWPDYEGSASDHLEADIYEYWLDAADVDDTAAAARGNGGRD